MNRMLGAVLAGGASRRFGSDKALAKIHGMSLIDHAITSLKDIADAIVICGRPYPGALHLPDRPTADIGPLGGLNAALHYGKYNGCSSVLTVPCDTPFIPLAALSDLAKQNGPWFVAEHPVIGVWPTSLADDLDRLLQDNNDRSMRKWARQSGARPFPIRGIVNINYREDLNHLLTTEGRQSPE